MAFLHRMRHNALHNNCWRQQHYMRDKELDKSRQMCNVLTMVDLPESTLPMMATLSSAGDTEPGLALALTTTSAVALSARSITAGETCDFCAVTDACIS